MSQQLSEIYEIINGVLTSINQPVLGENDNLKPEKLDFGGYERYWSINDVEKLSFMFEVDESRVTFHIDRTHEIPEFSYKEIINNREEFEKVLLTVLTNKSRIKHKGNKTTVEFIDQEGKTTYFFRMYLGIGLSFLYTEKVFEYPPYFLLSK